MFLNKKIGFNFTKHASLFYQVKKRMIPDFKVVTQSDLETLLGTHVVTLMKLNLRHQQVS